MARFSAYVGIPVNEVSTGGDAAAELHAYCVERRGVRIVSRQGDTHRVERHDASNGRSDLRQELREPRVTADGVHDAR